MDTDNGSAQEKQWQVLHDRMTELLDRFGRKDPLRHGDYWLLDENWGWERQQLEFQNLKLLQPQIIKLLQSLLADFPKWDITVRIDVPGKENDWPGMGLVIYHSEIIDDLQRQYLPEEFRSVVYETARRPRR